MNIWLSLLKGFSASSGLIIAIGAQNAFVIRQGLKREHLLAYSPYLFVDRCNINFFG